jgi:hypothetical protein
VGIWLSVGDDPSYAPDHLLRNLPPPLAPVQEASRGPRRHANAHAALDRAVWATYGWKDDPAATTDENILGRRLALNGERAAQSGKT